ncbi:MAG TPA: response regulator transcription factor [Planctomycetaceae bacterium]|nr:response regulator transcription factor [Planctomycetaceae bacterium]
MTRCTILTIEDDAAIRRGIADALEFAGYRVLEADRGDTGLNAALRLTYDLLLLDLVLPGLDGLELLGQVREARPTLPVIILSARGEETDRVKGLKLGADDYVVKPFSVKELTARVEAVLRRSPERPNHAPRLTIPGGVADLSKGEIRYEDGERIELTERESEILRYLAGHAGRTISRDELISRVWRLNPQGLHTRAIDMQIARLREKLRDSGCEPQVIRTVRGRGYVYENVE